MSAHFRPAAWTLDEFLAWERAQPERYEFDGVQPVAMVGGSLRHSAIATALVEALGRRLRPPCTAFRGDVKLRVAEGRVRYPDAAVTCADPLPEEDDILPDPVAVFEVLSPSTAALDRTVKAAEYLATPSVLAYVMLAQEAPVATVLHRRGAGEPPREERVEGEDAAIHLPEIGVAALPLREVYLPRRA